MAGILGDACKRNVVRKGRCVSPCFRAADFADVRLVVCKPRPAYSSPMSKARIIPIARTFRTTLPPGRDLAAPPEGELVDLRGRRVRDLRISVTDRCNFRCVYCMPKEVFDDDYAYLPRSKLLSFEEIVRIAKIFVDQGVEKIRITGGEPLLRRHIENLIEQLAKLPVEITLTTNGSLLKKKAQALKDAGLQRVTVSLDGMDDAVFKRMNDVDYAVGVAPAFGDFAGVVGINGVEREFGMDAGDDLGRRQHLVHAPAVR